MGKNSEQFIDFPPAGGKPRKEKILIVDDIEENRFILKEILGSSYDVEEASDGREALEKITGNRRGFSLVLLDIMMPEVDGYEVLEKLSRDGILNELPVVVITASGGGENEVRGLELGAADYITKPFFPRSVILRVETQLELRKYKKYFEKAALKKQE